MTTVLIVTFLCGADFRTAGYRLYGKYLFLNGIAIPAAFASISVTLADFGRWSASNGADNCCHL